MNAADAVPRERGWRRLLPAVALFLLVQAFPPLRVLIPIEQTLLLLVPALAVCAWLAWRAGGRISFALAWTVLALVMLTQPMAGGPSYVAFARGWATVLAAAFGAVGLWAGMRPFFARALGALAITGAAAMIALAFAGATPKSLGRVIDGELNDRMESSVAAFRADVSASDMQELEKTNPERARMMNELFDMGEAQLRASVPVGTNFFPAILAFESLAALGLAWSLHHRLSRARIGPPLVRLRDFRFEDQLLWGCVIGVVLTVLPLVGSFNGGGDNVALPSLATWQSVGSNVFLFFGTLYVLRGLGVMTWFLVAPGRWMGVVLIALSLPLWPLPLLVGLSDSRFDWRRRLRPTNQGNSQ